MAKVKGNLTHIMYRSVRDKFRRAGIIALKTPQVLPIDSLSEEQLKALEGQKDEIITERITEERAAAIRDGREDQDGRTRAELLTVVAQQNEQIAKLQAQLAEYKVAMSGDRPPKQGTAVDGAGAPNPLPTPGDERNPLPPVR